MDSIGRGNFTLPGSGSYPSSTPSFALVQGFQSRPKSVTGAAQECNLPSYLKLCKVRVLVGIAVLSL